MAATATHWSTHFIRILELCNPYLPHYYLVVCCDYLKGVLWEHSMTLYSEQRVRTNAEGTKNATCDMARLSRRLQSILGLRNVKGVAGLFPARTVVALGCRGRVEP